MFRGNLLVCALAFLGLAVAGCGDSVSLYQTSGTVTYQGKPIEGASILFIPEKGIPGTGTTDSAGKYTISTNGKPGATLGKNQVTVSKQTMTGGTATGSTPEDMKKMQSGPNAMKSKHELPPLYAVPGGSGLSAEVSTDAAKNVFDFALKN